jgi:hypothetical protein
MDATTKPVAIIRWLPYWAVLQANLQQTLRSWIYRFWVLLFIPAAVGYIIYRMGLANEAGITTTCVENDRRIASLDHVSLGVARCCSHWRHESFGSAARWPIVFSVEALVAISIFWENGTADYLV